MLDSETRRRIDNARNILVGKVPDPKSQVEQITIALIYKFMDDMDAEAEELGGLRSFFVGEYEKYSWAKLLSPALGGFEMLGLYSEAMERMTRNQGVPQLFRDIFKNAYLPYRDPDTLRMFLKNINEFNYDHSEKLGDAFEYLLSVLGSQGDAGQFRTPRHIIDFMVRVIDPQKEDSLLDPACGTAGFLISAYKHVLARNAKDGRPGAALSPDERARLADHLRGYDISPDMVRLSLVNLYLHGFSTPNIFEYDTLTSDQRWNEYADVILANPPFMSPKGGIQPHKRFSVQSNRSEVLFVDYMAEHLTPNGRAAIIVPEGIIFQSAGAYKQLRKYLLENNYIWAVVSLPSGMFNPYAGVKTSILLLDRGLAKRTGQVLFVKVEKDGYDLGAQRRALCNEMEDKPELCPTHSDLPVALATLQAWRGAVLNGTTADFTPALSSALLVPVTKLAESGDYNLSADRYRQVVKVGKQVWPRVALGDISEIISGQSPEGEYYNETGDGLPFYQGKTEFTEKYLADPRKWTTQITKVAEKDDILMSVRAPVGPVNIATQKICIGRGLAAIRPIQAFILLEFLFSYLKTIEAEITGNSGAVFPSINRNDIANLQIPLPPLDIQRQIVDEIAACQRIIDGARQVVEAWKPDLELELEQERKSAGVEAWEVVKLGDVCSLVQYGLSSPLNTGCHGYKTFRMNEIIHGIMHDNGTMKYADISASEFEKFKLNFKDLLFNRTNSFELFGKTGIFLLTGDYTFASYLIRLTINKDKALPEFISTFMNTEWFQKNIKLYATQAIGQSNINATNLKQFELPIPPVSVQRAIIERIEAERRAVEACRTLIATYEAKIQKIIARVWEG